MEILLHCSKESTLMVISYIAPRLKYLVVITKNSVKCGQQNYLHVKIKLISEYFPLKADFFPAFIILL